MNEMIPKPNVAPAEIVKETDSDTEPVLDPEKYVVVTELAPSQPNLESLSEALGTALDAAADYDGIMSVLKLAVAKNGHQTVETILVARYTEEPSSANKFYVQLIGKIAETHTAQSVESYSDPSFEGMNLLSELVESFSEAEVQMVADIMDAAEALASPERKRLKDAIAPVYKLACKLRFDSLAAFDTDRTKYPEFWRIFTAFEAMHRAVGVINGITKTVRHDLTVKLWP